MIYFHCFHRKYWHFSRKNELVLLQKCSPNTVGRWELGGVLPLHYEFPWDVVLMSEMVHMGYQKSAFFGQKRIFSFFPCRRQTLLEGWGSNNPPAMWWLPYQWADGPFSTSDPELRKSFPGVCWWKIAAFLRKKSTAEMEVAFVMALIVLLLFYGRQDSVTLFITCGKCVEWKPNPWKSNPPHTFGKSHWNTRLICRACQQTSPSYYFKLPLSGSQVKIIVKWNFPE